MIIAVGSTNDTKLEAVRRAIYGEGRVAAYGPLLLDEIKGYAVSSGVSDQPFEISDIIEGAMNRARNAFTDKRKSNT